MQEKKKMKIMKIVLIESMKLDFKSVKSGWKEVCVLREQTVKRVCIKWQPNT